MAVVFDPSINNLIAVKNGNGDMGKNVALQIRAALTMILGRPPTKDDFIPKPNSKTTTNTTKIYLGPLFVTLYFASRNSLHLLVSVITIVKYLIFKVAAIYIFLFSYR